MHLDDDDDDDDDDDKHKKRTIQSLKLLKQLR